MRKMLFFEGWKVGIYENRVYLYIMWVVGDGVRWAKFNILEME